MANKYVDLSATSNGSGTIGSPWTWLQFYADVSGAGGTVVNGDVILLRGGKDITLSPSGSKSLKNGNGIGDFQIILSAWDITQGPWRLYDSANRIALNGIIEIDGGVIISDYQSIDLPSIMLYTSSVNTTFIKAPSVALRSFPESSASPVIGYCSHKYCGDVNRNMNFFGSTIISKLNDYKILYLDYREPTLLQLKDSVVYIDSQKFQNGSDALSVENKTPVSAISAVWNWDVVPSNNLCQLSGTARITSSSHIQYGWEVPISWPSWSADKQDFAYITLGKGITISGSNNW